MYEPSFPGPEQINPADQSFAEAGDPIALWVYRASEFPVDPGQEDARRQLMATLLRETEPDQDMGGVNVGLHDLLTTLSDAASRNEQRGIEAGADPRVIRMRVDDTIQAHFNGLVSVFSAGANTQHQD